MPAEIKAEIQQLVAKPVMTDGADDEARFRSVSSSAASTATSSVSITLTETLVPDSVLASDSSLLISSTVPSYAEKSTTLSASHRGGDVIDALNAGENEAFSHPEDCESKPLNVSLDECESIVCLVCTNLY